MQPRKQPKIHKYSKRKKKCIKSPIRTFLSIVFTFAIAGAVGVVGYSIAKPLLQFEETKQEQHQTVQESTKLSATVTVQEHTTVQPVEEETTKQAIAAGQTGVVLTENDMADEKTFAHAVRRAREQQPYAKVLVIPLKGKGGTVLYQTKVALAKACGAVQGTMPLSKIVEIAKAEGFISVGSISLLDDNLLPNAVPEAGFLVSDGSRWLDNSKENGGKAWVSPYSDVTRQYLTELIEEITAADVAQIWCADVKFPAFRSSDLLYIGEIVQSDSRNTALIELINAMTDAAGTIPVYLQVESDRLIDGTEEAFVPEQLDVSGIVLHCGETLEHAQEVLQILDEKQFHSSMWVVANQSMLSEIMEIQKQCSSEISILGYAVYE